MSRCPICRRQTDRSHTGCRNAVDEHLRQIPGLYRLLADVLEPGTNPSARVSGSRTPPLPVRLEPLSLRGRGGIVTILATWETDWREMRGYPPILGRADREQLVAGENVVVYVCSFLRVHLDWAIDHHPAVDAFAGEIREIVEACFAALGARNDLMKVGQCPTVRDDGKPCGQVLYADPYGDTIRCGRCRADWPRNRWIILGGAMAG